MFARDYFAIPLIDLWDSYRLMIPASLKNGWRRFGANLRIGSFDICVYVSWSDVILWQNDKKMCIGAYLGLRKGLPPKVWHRVTIEILSRVKPQVLRGRKGREGSERTTCSSHFFVKFVTFYVKVEYSCGTKCTMIQWSIGRRPS